MDFLSEIKLEIPPPSTHPVIQCVIQDDLESLKILLTENNINGQFPCTELDDDITPLIAAVVYQKWDIVIYLLEENGDPNVCSKKNLTPLQYVGQHNAPAIYARRLLKAGADPNRRLPQTFTPLQIAGFLYRDDVMKELLTAGALVDLIRPTKPEDHSLNRKIAETLYRLASSGDELCSKLRDFVELKIALLDGKEPEEVFRTFVSRMLLVDPQTHLTIIELLFNVTGKNADKYRTESIKWLKKNGDLISFISGAVSRLPNIHPKCLRNSIKSLNAVFCTMEQIPVEQALDIIPELLERLCKNKRSDKLIEDVQSTLYVIIQKTQVTNVWHPSFIEKLCRTVAPFVNGRYSSDTRVYTYGIVGNLLSVKHAVSIFTSAGITSVPVEILAYADMKMNDKLKEVLRRLKDHLSKLNEECEGARKKTQDPNDEVCSASTDPAVPAEASGTHNWLPISKRWREKLERLVHCLKTDESKVTRIGSIAYISDVDFRIANGSDGTEVFLGLRESDGQEIAIKRMSKTNYQVLKNEEVLLRLPKLYDSCVVKYVDFAEDENFGYLCLQLCEYTLEEHIKKKDHGLHPQELVYDVLDSLRALHCKEPQILHRDLKPQNVLIDVNGRARLADFGISRRLPKNQTTYHTRSAGTEGWMATETLKEDGDIRYKSSTDIQVAGMLIYFILSGGDHPFGDRFERMLNIKKGKYTLDHVQDVVAKDLIERMIGEEPKNRPRVEECLSHPFFWTSTKKLEYLREVGDKDEVKSRQNGNKELISMGVLYNQWKTKFSPDLIQRVDDKKIPYPENILGLLRFMRNLHVHHKKDAASVDLTSLFPDLFRCVYKFSIRQGWNLEYPLKEMFIPEKTVGANGPEVEPINDEEHVGLVVQETEQLMSQLAISSSVEPASTD
ncbi:uncharacterized protein LOC128430070 isoform X3 [Pleuronectes platessa]|uniref:uncharacterized protein LOC128430070 isoform X3 n=1 Tax=Pleuronectes platessa TaxID=8262 RepID=UPI00232A5550|nr:uncharacterized protein LOC128430070 isoform X3 [Pleuronectes platessa]